MVTVNGSPTMGIASNGTLHGEMISIALTRDIPGVASPRSPRKETYKPQP
jgi:hypothetical protein